MVGEFSSLIQRGGLLISRTPWKIKLIGRETYKQALIAVLYRDRKARSLLVVWRIKKKEEKRKKNGVREEDMESTSLRKNARSDNIGLHWTGRWRLMWHAIWKLRSPSINSRKKESTKFLYGLHQWLRSFPFISFPFLSFAASFCCISWPFQHGPILLRREETENVRGTSSRPTSFLVKSILLMDRNHRKLAKRWLMN